ncbi:MAG: hypothetical protein RIS47_1964 [Bacteroidota bacterium]|jgi:hypothetical protein
MLQTNKINDIFSIRYTQSAGLITQKANDGLIIVPISDQLKHAKSIVALKQVGAFIWEQFNGQNTVADISELISQHYDIDQVTASNDLLEFIESLDNLITPLN